MKKIVIVIIMGITLSTLTFAQSENDFVFDGKGTITGYNGSETSIVIPAKINSVPVTAIGNSAFENKQLTSVIIPDGVNFIGDWSFYNNQITSIIIPNSVTVIGAFAFNSNFLNLIIIPDSVTKMGMEVFSDNLLTFVSIGKGLNVLDYGVFSRNKLNSITLPPNIVQIEGDSFVDNPITSITLGENVSTSWGILNEKFDGFETFYILNKQKAGTYEYKNGKWNIVRVGINL